MTCCAKADASPYTDLIEVNVSCPNVHHGGMSFGTDPHMVYDVTRAVKEVCRKPVYMKLSPNVTDIVSIAQACEKGGADGLSLINTLMGMRIDLKKRAPVLGQHHRRSFRTSGFSRGVADGLAGLRGGPSAHHWDGRHPKRGRCPGNDAGRSDRCAGGAANLVNPFACQEIIDSLPGLMERLGIQEINEIIGGAHRWEKM